MYPNIILTNRLQPPAMVTDATCASCKYFDHHKECRRELKVQIRLHSGCLFVYRRWQWYWRGEYFPSSASEVRQLQGQLQRDSTAEDTDGHLLKSRVKTYCQKVQSLHLWAEIDCSTAGGDQVYKKTHVTVHEERTSLICQRENSFYVDTVRDFKERRSAHARPPRFPNRMIDS